MHRSLSPLERSLHCEKSLFNMDRPRELPPLPMKSANSTVLGSLPPLFTGKSKDAWSKVRIGAHKSNVLFEKRKVYNRSRSGMGEGSGKAMDQSTDSLKTLSPIGKLIRPPAEESKDLEISLIKSDKTIIGKENAGQDVIRHRSSMGTFLGEGCVSFLSQPSLLSKLTSHAKNELNVFSLEALSSPELLGEQLSLLVATPSVDAIQLPPCRILLGDLVIRRNVTFIGCPGTQLVTQASPISLKPNAATPTTARFVECAFILIVNSSSSDLQSSTQILFEVNEGTNLELQDCQLKAEGNSPSDSRAEVSYTCPTSKDQSSICINLLGSTLNKSGSKTGLLPGQVNILSCSFLYFTRGILAENNNLVWIEKSGLFKSLGSAIVAINPLKLYIEGSNIEDCGDAGIELQWTRPDIPDETEREIKVVNSYISETRDHGLLLVGAGTYFKSILTLTGNRIQSCVKDGLHIRDLAVAELVASSNNVNSVIGNGISVYRCKISKFTIKANNVKHNQGTGIYVVSTSCAISSCECSGNMLAGITVSGCSSISEKKDTVNIDVKILDCTIKENKQNGISVLDLRSGTVFIEKCSISYSKEYGLFLSNNEYLTPQSTLSSDSSKGSKCSRVLLERGEISYNKSGIYLQQQYTHIEATAVKANGEYAICIPHKIAASCLELSPQTIARKCVQGLVGGPWGSVTAGSRGDRCGCTVCTVV